MQIWEVTKKAVKTFKVPQKLSDLRIRISNSSSSGSTQLCPLLLTVYTTVNPTDNLDMFIKKIPSWEKPEILINVR